MKRTLAVLLFASSALAQSSSESIEVRVLEIEAAVVDRAGRPVDGLSRDDFEVRLGGRKQDITNFFAVRDRVVVEPASRDRAADARITTIPTSLVIFIDDLHLRPASKKRALDALDRYVRAHIGSNTTAMLVRYNKQLTVRVRPTERPGHILAELEAMKREPALGDANEPERKSIIELIDFIFQDPPEGPGAITPADSPDRIWYQMLRYAEREAREVDQTLTALRDAIQLSSGFEGRKVLLYVSDGLAQSPYADVIDYFTQVSKNSWWSNHGLQYRFDNFEAQRFDRTLAFQSLARDAQRANVSFFSFDAAGLRGLEARGPSEESTIGRMNSFLVQTNLRGGPQLLADETGGRYIAYENNPDIALAKINEQFSTYYSLGVRAPGKSRALDLRVSVKNRPELRVITARRRTALSREQEVAQNVRSRLYTRASDNPLGAEISVSPVATVSGRCLAPVRVDVPHQSPGSALEVHFAVLNERNDESEVRTTLVPVTAETVTHSFTIGLQPRKHVLSVAIVDPLTGAASYLQQEVDGSQCR